VSVLAGDAAFVGGAENAAAENAEAITYGKPSGKILQTVVYDDCDYSLIVRES